MLGDKRTRHPSDILILDPISRASRNQSVSAAAAAVISSDTQLQGEEPTAWQQ